MLNIGVPLLALKPKYGATLVEDPQLLLSVARRSLHHNMCVGMLSAPSEARLAGTVGGMLPKGRFNMWLDSENNTLHGIAHKGCPLWIADFRALRWAWKLADSGAGEPRKMETFWHCGSRHCLSSASGDKRVLRVHYEGGAPLFPRGTRVYILVLQSVHQSEFVYKCLTRGVFKMELPECEDLLALCDVVPEADISDGDDDGWRWHGGSGKGS